MEYVFNIYQASSTSRSHPVLSIEFIIIHIEMCVRGVWSTPAFCTYNNSGLMNCGEQYKLLHFICETPSVNNRKFEGVRPEMYCVCDCLGSYEDY